MESDGDRDRARGVLALVTADPDLLDRFVAAWTTDEDPLAALREAADPSQPSDASQARQRRIAEHQRVAYGRTETSDDLRAATHARGEIEKEVHHRAVVDRVLQRAIEVVEASQVPVAAEPGDTAESAVGPAAAPPTSVPVEAVFDRDTESLDDPVTSPRSIRAIWIVPIAAVCLAVGAIASSVVGAAHDGLGTASVASPVPATRTSTGSPAPGSGRVATVVRTYTTSQIAAWFAAAQTDIDHFPDVAELASINVRASATRFVANDREGASLYVAHSTQGKSCLLVEQLNSRLASATCLSSAAITSGKALIVDEAGINASWTALDLVVAIPEG